MLTMLPSIIRCRRCGGRAGFQPPFYRHEPAGHACDTCGAFFRTGPAPEWVSPLADRHIAGAGSRHRRDCLCGGCPQSQSAAAQERAARLEARA